MRVECGQEKEPLLGILQLLTGTLGPCLLLVLIMQVRVRARVRVRLGE
jgi:hypothetical protein